ncbi:histidine phosphatase family protein [Massilia sp. BSC265]|uniref:histidine phosphatase family protein n=1 Tax=Massilia sp. BSC265 TaxID=1549812 RepID=UPI0004E94803|nr:histidine phosphatase family protein [Massilia sp. BSC265]KFI07364.1 phosphoglycerate mutase [Massilia sp. BSC265]
MLSKNNAVAPTTILLIRHGETAWNAEKRLQGHLDIALNAEGERQAALLGAALAAERIDHIVSSDLQRARQTADAIARARGAQIGTQVDIEPALRERCYGGFEGLLYSEIAARFPLEFAAWQARDVDGVLPPGANRGESFREFYERVTGAIAEHAAAHPGKTIALVAHGGVLECAYRAALGLSLETPRDFKVLNASVNRFVMEEGVLRLVSWGEVSHLQPAVLDDLT